MIALPKYGKEPKSLARRTRDGVLGDAPCMIPIFKGKGDERIGCNVYIEGDKKGNIDVSARVRFMTDELKAVVKEHGTIAFTYTENADGHDISMLVFLELKGEDIIADARLSYPLPTPEYEAFKNLFKGKEIAFYL